MLKVIIVNHSGIVHCQVGCGLDWSQPGNLKLAEERLQARYGTEVQLEYRDLARTGKVFSEAGEAEEEARFPRLLINGKMKIAGDFDLRMLLDAVEVEAEIEG